MKKNYIITRSGLRMPYDCEPAKLRLRDAAHGLAKKSRYTGQCKGYYSVAEHCVLMARWILAYTGCRKLAIIALLHDAVEAYWSDMPKPYKDKVRKMVKMEKQWLKKIAKHYGFAYPIPAIIHEADARIRIDETRVLFPAEDPTSFGSGKDAKPLGVKIQKWGWKKARREFMKMCDELGLKD